MSSRPDALPKPDPNATLGTYVGVFRPTLLTIIGLVLYLREGWMIGSVGLVGGLAIITATFLITGATALSFSSITTNIRIGEGGAFSIVSQSLGLEAGGAIGIPMYLAQALSIAFYVYGFAEGWLFLFPSHPRALILVAVTLVGFGLSLFSERLALRMQLVVMLGVGTALICIFAGVFTTPTLHTPQLFGGDDSVDPRTVFAVFFPAGTGIMVGASMSGKLANPRRSIPVGILGAWGAAFIVYAGLAVWFSLVASPTELRENYLIATEYAIWKPAVIIGLMSSCFSAMLGSSVAAPNVLAALGRRRVIPSSAWFASQARGGTPRNAVLATAVIVGATLSLGSLDRGASLITMFFLVTYATINLVLLVEQSLHLISFRPTFSVPIWVPLFGAVSTVLAMAITNPVAGLIALGVVIAIYVQLSRRRIETPWETVRSGVVVAFADWAAKATQRISGPLYRAWKPDILVPISRAEQLAGEERLLHGVVRPRGSVQVLAIVPPGEGATAPTRLEPMIDAFRAANVLATHAEVRAADFADGVQSGLEVLEGSFFRPNLLWVHGVDCTQDTLRALLRGARAADVGFVLFMPHREAGLGMERQVNVWLRDPTPDFELALKLANVDLAILLAYQLHENWRAKMRLVSLIGDPSHLPAARALWQRLAVEARLPRDAELLVEATPFTEGLSTVPRADLNIMGLREDVNIEALEELVARLGASVLFVHDSSHESVLA
ncbi:MAG: amino acid permease [Nannocystaceae bacterium]